MSEDKGETKMDDLISVIIPVYNSEIYIEDCIKSVLEQTYTRLEVLIVDDGSLDKSKEICKRMSREDKRIRFVEQEHSGVSAARNRGMDEAEGKYFFFLDSDDIIHVELLEKLYEILKKEKIALAAEDYCYQRDDLYQYSNQSEKEIAEYSIFNNENLLDVFNDATQKLFYGITGKMYESNVAKIIRFDEALTNGEDTKFIYQTILSGVDAVIFHRNWYYYRKPLGSASRQRTVTACQSIYQSLRFICDQEEKNGRIKNAIRWENYILKCMMDWIMLTRQIHNDDRRSFLQSLACQERGRSIFAKVSRERKQSFYLAFYCYPLYILDEKLICWQQRKRQMKYEKKQRIRTEQLERKKMFIELQRLRQDEAKNKTNKEIVEVISVIIPASSGTYIEKCIASVLNQTYTNLEIIVVGSGTVERELSICKKIPSNDSRIRLITEECKNISVARNKGIDVANGKYIFFLNSEDAIHPLLLEELLFQMEEYQAELAMCGQEKLYAIWMDKVLKELSEKDERPEWQIVEKEYSEEWIHMKNANELMRVGVLIRKDLIGKLRFDENMICGEDALFMYQLICKKNRIIYSQKRWYYCRICTENTEYSQEVMRDRRYYDIYKILRDNENKRGHIRYSLAWERRLLWLMRQSLILMKQVEDEEGEKIIKEQALIERRNPLFKKISLVPRLLFLACFLCSPAYYFVLERAVKRLDKAAWRIKERLSHSNSQK